MFEKFRKWWLFRVENPVVRKGESGGFRWVFRRYWLDIETLSGNFKARFTASENPYGYLLAGQDDENILGFAQTLYYLGSSLTTDQKLCNDIGKAYKSFVDRLEKKAAAEVKEDEFEEKVALEEVKQIYEKVRDPKTGRFVKRATDVDIKEEK